MAMEPPLAPLAGCPHAGHYPHNGTWWLWWQEYRFLESDRLRDLALTAYWLCDLRQKVFNDRLMAETCCQDSVEPRMGRAWHGVWHVASTQ